MKINVVLFAAALCCSTVACERSAQIAQQQSKNLSLTPAPKDQLPAVIQQYLESDGGCGRFVQGITYNGALYYWPTFTIRELCFFDDTNIYDSSGTKITRDASNWAEIFNQGEKPVGLVWRP